MLQEGAEVDAGVLLGIAVGSWRYVSLSLKIVEVGERMTYAGSG